MEQTKTGKVWQKYVDDSYELYYVDYNDDLSNHLELLQECVCKNSLSPLQDQVWDWWDAPGYEELTVVGERMRDAGLEKEFEENRDDIQQYIWDHDESTPMKDLLRNTGELVFFYSLSECNNKWVEAPFMTPYMAEQPEDTAKKICKLLNIAENAKEAKQILNICYNSSYGGELRIYFKANVEDFINGDSMEMGDKKDDWKSIRFKGKFALAIYNSTEGAGDWEYVDLDIEVPFIRENLALSQNERYNIEKCFGMSDDWIESDDKPVMGFESSQISIKKSVQNERERRFEEVFKAGGCSVDDNNFKRHRDVYYRNNFPCGNVCPHCGHIWYD